MREFLRKFNAQHFVGLILIAIGSVGMFMKIEHMGWVLAAGVFIAANA